MKKSFAAFLGTLALSLSTAALCAGEPAGQLVQLIRTPDGGLQPELVVDDKEILHLIYFKEGDPGHERTCSMYARTTGARAIPAPEIRVNSDPGAAVVMGTIRGGHIAVGKAGRIHVAWNGSAKASERGPLIPGLPGSSTVPTMGCRAALYAIRTIAAQLSSPSGI